MADTKISALPASTTPLAGTEVLPIVQSSATKQVSVANLTAGRAVSAASLTLTTTPLPVASGGTALSSLNANGILYASSSSAVATNASFVFDGTALGVGGTPVNSRQITAKTAGQTDISIVGGSTNYAQLMFGYVGADNKGIISYYNTDNSMTFYTSGSARAIIGSSGIVTMNAYGAGAATFSAAGVISSVSDETWKIKDGVPTNPDVMLKKLEPGYWYYNDEKKETFGSDRQLGFYAQNVNAAIGPEAAPEPSTFVTKNNDGIETTVTKPWGYYDRSVLAITVMSLQKALADIESLTARIEALEAK